MSQPPQYDPPKGDYPPPQQGYPPPQQGYPPPQQGYPPPQQGYPAQPGYPPPQQGGQTTVVVAQPAIAVGQALRETPVRMCCQSCRADIVTATSFETGTMTWLIAGVLCIFGCWPCCLIPFCVDGCKDVIHTCPNCKATVGVFRRM